MFFHGDHSVAMGHFGEVTGHEMGQLWILRPYSYGRFKENKRNAQSLKELIAYSISPPVTKNYSVETNLPLKC